MHMPLSNLNFKSNLLLISKNLKLNSIFLDLFYTRMFLIKKFLKFLIKTKKTKKLKFKISMHEAFIVCLA